MDRQGLFATHRTLTSSWATSVCLRPGRGEEHACVYLRHVCVQTSKCASAGVLLVHRVGLGLATREQATAGQTGQLRCPRTGGLSPHPPKSKPSPVRNGAAQGCPPIKVLHLQVLCVADEQLAHLLVPVRGCKVDRQLQEAVRLRQAGGQAVDAGGSVQLVLAAAGSHARLGLAGNPSASATRVRGSALLKLGCQPPRPNTHTHT